MNNYMLDDELTVTFRAEDLYRNVELDVDGTFRFNYNHFNSEAYYYNLKTKSRAKVHQLLINKIDGLSPKSSSLPIKLVQQA